MLKVWHDAHKKDDDARARTAKYRDVKYSNHRTLPGVYLVHLDGKIVGRIKAKDGVYRYFPKGDRVGGEPFLNFDDCTRILELP